MRGGEEEEEEPKWWNREEEEEEEEEELSSLLPKPEELIPISQTLIPTDLALAFDIDDDPSVFAKRPRLVWTPHLHRRFVESVSQLGIKNAVPKAIMQLMCVEGLTRENVASHLQKYRQYLKRVGSGLLVGVGDPALDRLFSSSPVPPLFLHQSAVGTVGELVLRPEGFRGVAENGSGSDRILDRSFQMGQSQQSSSDKCDNLSPFSAVGRVRELKVGTEGFRGVGGSGLVSNLVSDRSFMMGQSQQSSTNGGKFSPFPAVGVVQELGFQGVGRNGLVSNLVSERSFFMGQSQQSSIYRENLSPFSALGPVQELGFRPEGFRGMGANGSGSNAFFDRSLQTGQSQMYGSSPMCVDEMVSGDSGGGRRVLTLFPTREDD